MIQTVCSVGFMLGMMIDIGPKFYSVPPPPMHFHLCFLLKVL